MAGVRGRLILGIIVILALGGCSPEQAGTGSGMASDSPVGPGGVRLKMTRTEVIQIMLDDVQLLQMTGQVKNPYATRFVQDTDGELLEVMYYYTGMKKPDDQVSNDELVPIILKEDAVVGWGWEYLEKLTGNRPGP